MKTVCSRVMKLKERVLIAVLSGVVLLTIFLVLDVETRLSHKKIQPSHSRVQYNFRHRQLQKTFNASREGGGNSAGLTGTGGAAIPAAASQQIHKEERDPGVVDVVPAKGQKALHVASSHKAAASTGLTAVQPPQSFIVKNWWDGNNEIETPPPVKPHVPYLDLAAIAKKAEDMHAAERRRYQHWNPTIGDILGLQLT